MCNIDQSLGVMKIEKVIKFVSFKIKTVDFHSGQTKNIELIFFRDYKTYMHIYLYLHM